MRVEQIFRYPVKGLSPEALGAVTLEAGQGLPWDRTMAFAQGDSAFDPAEPKWLPKRHFACLMMNAVLARVHSAFDPATGQLSLAMEGHAPITARVATAEGRAALEAWLGTAMGADARGALRLAEVPGHAFTDIPQKAVSLIGLASVADLSTRIGLPLDPLRFRGNIQFSGAEPFAELDWVGREVLLGGARLRIFKRTQRCAATEVNPETGERDMMLPRLLRKGYGHIECGVYARVLTAGRIAPGDGVGEIG